MNLNEHLYAVMHDGEPVSVSMLMGSLKARGGHGVSRAQVERALQQDAAFVKDGTRTKPLWRFTGVTKEDAKPLTLPELWPWQSAALLAWSQTCQGVIEAVTGTGKTRIALAAIATVLQQGGRALVLVPGSDLLMQWEREVKALLPSVRVGRLGVGGDDDLFHCDVLIATAQSASRVPIDLPYDTLGLVVADEVHRFGAETWSDALPEVFTLRLALTATFERDDDGIDTHLTPYFAQVVFTYDFAHAAKDGVIAPFAVAMTPVAFTPGEQAAYDKAQQRVSGAYKALLSAGSFPREPHAFLQAVTARVSEAQRTGKDTPVAARCRDYLYWLRQRRDVAAVASGKLDALGQVCGGLQGRRTLVFTDTVEQAEAAARVVNRHGLIAEVLHGALDERTRKARMAAFRAGRTHVIVAPRVLDEGVDVPDADVAVVLSAFQTRRQMVQRLGRVVRLKADGRPATCVVLFTQGTREDPANGGYQAFLATVEPAATEVLYATDVGQVVSRLNPV